MRSGVALTLLLLAAPVRAESEPEDPHRLEIGGLPAVAFDSSIGVGAGIIGNLARFDPEADPFAWRLSLQGFVFFKDGPDGIELPFQHHYAILDRPHSFARALRLRLETRFRRQTNAGYFGLGNASKERMNAGDFDAAAMPAAHERAFRFHQYDRVYPSARLSARYTLREELLGFASAGLAWNWINLYPGSQLAEEAAALVGTARHGVLESKLGLLWDSRDDEFTPRAGMYHELSFRFGKLIEHPAAYGGAHLAARLFQSIWEEYLVLAGRVMVDLLFGDAPFYEQAVHGGEIPKDAIAGPEALRGLPGQRYHGKIKLLANLELRSKLVHFPMFGLKSNLGLVGFFDLGRVFADYASNPALDGEGLGLKYAFGGGLRLQWGRTFIIRGDVGSSPDGLGIYLSVDHIF